MSERTFSELTPQERADVEYYEAIIEADADGTLPDNIDVYIAYERIWAIYNPKAAREEAWEDQALRQEYLDLAG